LAAWEIQAMISQARRKAARFWITDANLGDGRRFIVVRADEMLTAFVELQ
jgi:hypothetical protein